MNPLNPWLVFRSLSVACLAAILLVAAFWVYMARYTAAEGLWVAARIVLPTVILFLVGLSIDRSFRLTDRIAVRYGYRRIGIIFYVLLALAVALTQSAMNYFSTFVTIILIVGSFLPGLLLLAWWGLHKIARRRAAKA